MVELEPYGAMSDADERAVAEACARADLVVVVATPFGPSNVGNLRAAADAGARVVLAGELAEDADWTHGEAPALWRRLRDGGAVACPDAREIVRCIEEVSSE